MLSEEERKASCPRCHRGLSVSECLQEHTEDSLLRRFFHFLQGDQYTVQTGWSDGEINRIVKKFREGVRT